MWCHLLTAHYVRPHPSRPGSKPLPPCLMESAAESEKPMVGSQGWGWALGQPPASEKPELFSRTSVDVKLLFSVRPQMRAQPVDHSGCPGPP